MPETEQKHKSRKIGDLFSDYKTNSNIEDAEIARMNLLKKINTLEIEMQAKEYIEINKNICANIGLNEEIDTYVNSQLLRFQGVMSENWK